MIALMETQEVDRGASAGGGDASAAGPAGPAARPEPITPARLVGAFLVACALLFGLLVLFALVGLGPLGLAPAVVVAVSLTARITRIRRMSVLIAIGILSFLAVVAGTYAVAIAVYVGSRPIPG